MKREIRGFIAGAITSGLLCATVLTAFAAPVEKAIRATYNNIKIYVDGKEIQPKDANGKKVEPFISDGTTYLPIRAISQALGKSVDWDGKSYSVYVGGKPVDNISGSAKGFEINEKNVVVKLSVANDYIAVKVLFPDGVDAVTCTGVDGNVFSKPVQLKDNEYAYFDKEGISPGSSGSHGLFYEGDECSVDFKYISNGVEKTATVKTKILDRRFEE